MDIDELLSKEPNMSEFSSKKLLLEIFSKEEWRCYGSNICDESEELASRYLKHHARIPGLISNEMVAHNPASVFYFADDEDRESVKGGLFSNGAVIFSHAEGKRSTSLFIDEAAAQRLGYPDKGYVYLSQVESEDDI